MRSASGASAPRQPIADELVTYVVTASAISLDRGKAQDPNMPKGHLVDVVERLVYGERVIAAPDDFRIQGHLAAGALIPASEVPAGRPVPRLTARDIYNLGNSSPDDPASRLHTEAFPVAMPSGAADEIAIAPVTKTAK